MDWANERYVRIYTRDTVKLRLLSWQARAILWELIRKAERSGTIPLDECEPAEAVAALTGIPLDVVDEHLPQLMRGRRPPVAVAGDVLLLRNFMPAQETAQSDAQRKRESRAKIAAEAAAAAGIGIAVGHAKSDSVTKRDQPSQNVTKCHDSSQAVTSGHSESRLVTPSLASLNQADLNQTNTHSEIREVGANQSSIEQGADAGVCAGFALSPDPQPTVSKTERRLAAARVIANKLNDARGRLTGRRSNLGGGNPSGKALKAVTRRLGDVEASNGFTTEVAAELLISHVHARAWQLGKLSRGDPELDKGLKYFNLESPWRDASWSVGESIVDEWIAAGRPPPGSGPESRDAIDDPTKWTTKAGGEF